MESRLSGQIFSTISFSSRLSSSGNNPLTRVVSIANEGNTRWSKRGAFLCKKKKKRKGKNCSDIPAEWDNKDK